MLHTFIRILLVLTVLVQFWGGAVSLAKAAWKPATCPRTAAVTYTMSCHHDADETALTPPRNGCCCSEGMAPCRMNQAVVHDIPETVLHSLPRIAVPGLSGTLHHRIHIEVIGNGLGPRQRAPDPYGPVYLRTFSFLI